MLAMLAMAAVVAARGQTTAAAPGPVPASESAGSTQPSPNAQIITLIPSLIGEGSADVRKQAAAEILRLGSNESVVALVGVLNLKNNVPAKIAVCQAVADLEKPPAALAESLLTLLEQKDATPTVPPKESIAAAAAVPRETSLRDAVVAALRKYTDPDVQTRLRRFLEREEFEWLRAEHVARSKELFGLLKEADRPARLQSWLKAAQPIDRMTALEIIHSAMLATTPTPPAEDVLAQIRQMLKDPDEAVRRKVVVVLRDLQELEDAARLLTMAETERSPLVLEELYRALGRMGDPGAIGVCIEGLRNPSERVAAAAADALGRLCRKGNGQATGDPTPDDTKVVAALLERSAQPMPDALRLEVIGAMAEIADARFLPRLVAYAGPAEKMPGIRQAAIAGIGQIGGPAQIDLLVGRLADDPDPGVRDAAAEALGKLGSQTSHLAPLVARLQDVSPAVQNRAWLAYQAIFLRLSAADHQQVLDTWIGTDAATVAKRIDLLTDLEGQAVTLKLDAKQMMSIREQLGDALMSGTQYVAASAAYARALEAVPADQPDRRAPLAAKLMEAHLKALAYDKAIALATTSSAGQVKDALAERLLKYVQDLAKIDAKAAQDCIEKFRTGAPALVSGLWAAKFDEVKRAATQPATSATLPAVK